MPPPDGRQEDFRFRRIEEDIRNVRERIHKLESGATALAMLTERVGTQDSGLIGSVNQLRDDMRDVERKQDRNTQVLLGFAFTIAASSIGIIATLILI